MLPAMERLTNSTARIANEADSIIALVTGLAQQLRDNAGDPVAINKIADDLDGSSDKIAAKVLENTPAGQP